MNISVIDRDGESDDFDDLVDYFMIPINISAGSSVTSNFTGWYDHVQLEFTIEVRCIADENCECLPGFTGALCDINIDECTGITCNGRGRCVDEDNGYHCECLPGFTGALCDINIDECTGITCNGRGRCVDEDNGYHCECFPGFTGALCEVNIDECVGVTCNNRGKCVDGAQNFSCNCDPGSTGAPCETGQGNVQYMAAMAIYSYLGFDSLTC